MKYKSKFKRWIAAGVAGVMMGVIAGFLPGLVPEVGAPMTAEAAAFVPRTTAPAKNDPNYTTNNVFYKIGAGMPNCTCYAYGRAKELLGTEPALCHNGADKWYSYNINNNCYPYGNEPRLGAIACWSTQHVAVVEAIDGDTVWISESSYPNNSYPDGIYFRYISKNRHDMGSGFRGYIYIGDWALSPPTTATLSKSQVWYDLKDTVTLLADSDHATIYYISVLKDEKKVISDSFYPGQPFQFPAKQYGIGEYYAWISAANSLGSVDSKGVSFSVVGAAGYTSVSASKSVYTLNETVSITVNTLCAKGQVIGIDRIGDGRVITQDCPATYQIAAKELGVGKYSAYFSVYNGSGSVDTARVSFEIVTKLGAPGDCNSDGKTDVTDLILLQKWILKVPKASLKDTNAADMNQDGVIDIFDLALLKHRLLAK